jgi:hypothetical protein
MATPCTNFGSSSEVTLYYVVEPTATTADLTTATLTLLQVPITGESIDASLTSAVSEQITSQRSYAGSKLVGGEVTGSFNYEAQANTFFYDMLIGVLQANKIMTAGGTTDWVAGAPGAIKNGSTKHCLAFVKRVTVGTNLYDWYIFRGCQIGSLSLEIQPNALITGTVNIMGVKPQDPITAAAKPAAWTLTDVTAAPMMSGADSLQGFAIKSGGTSIGVTMQNLSLTIENQLRQQAAVGQGHPFSAGIASGRLSAKFAGSAYYAAPTVFAALLDDTSLTIEGSLLDADGDGITFSSDLVKVTAGSVPMASSPDQDLMITTEFQAFEDADTGTIEIAKVTA